MELIVNGYWLWLLAIRYMIQTTDVRTQGTEDRKIEDRAWFFFNPAYLTDCLRPVSFILSPLSFDLAPSL